MGLNKTANPPKRQCQSWRAVILCLWLATGLAAAETKTIVFFGDSLTAGYGVEPDEAFPALIQQKLETAGQPWRVVNAGLSGETTAGVWRRMDWILKQPSDIFVVELGGNDGLRGIAPEVTRANLEAIVQRIQAKSPRVKVVLAGMQMPSNRGADYTRQFAAIYPEVARKFGATLIPFLLEG